MTRPESRRLFTGLALALALGPAVLAAAPAPAGGPVRITRLGGPHAFARPPLRSGDDLKKLFATKQADLEQALALAGWDGKPQDLFDAIAAGRFEETTVAPGTAIQWMAMRERKKVKVLRDAVWEGKQPFLAYKLTLVSNDVRNEMVIPKACGNLGLLTRTPIPPPVARVKAAPGKDCIIRTIAIDASESSVSYGKVTAVTATVTGPDGKSEDLGPAGAGFKWAKSWKTPGTYTVSVVATSDSGRKSEPARASFELLACPPSCAIALGAADAWSEEDFRIDAAGSKAQVGTLKAVHVDVIDARGQKVATVEISPPFQSSYHIKDGGDYTLKAVAEDDLGQKSSNACEAAIRIYPKATLLSDWFAGKERRVRPEFHGGRCAALLGTKLGLSYMPNRRWELVLAPGFAFNARDDANWSLFVDGEVNRHFRGGFVGLGLSAWDFTHDEPGLAPAGLVQFGFDIAGTKVGRRPAQFFVQGRAPLDELDDLDNNYIVWAGLRLHIE